MLVVRVTRKLLRFVGSPTAPVDERGRTLLGPWYGNLLPWRRPVVVLVNEATLLPVFLPLKPLGMFDTRVADEIAAVLAAHDAPRSVVDAERQHMASCRYSTTANRSVLGIMNDFARLATHRHEDDPRLDLFDLSMWMSTTPCSPLFRGNVSPDRELAAKLRTLSV